MKQAVSRMEKSAMQPEHAGSFVNFAKHGSSNKRWQHRGKVKELVASHLPKSEGHLSPGNVDRGVLVLAEKMKELELMDLGDLEHVLDLEEALHYYSLLRSPVFLDIVHNFFMEIYSEFSMVPEPTRTSN